MYQPEHWLFDTGATVHITPTDTFLTNVVYHPQTIKVVEGTKVHSPKYGDLTLRSTCGGVACLLGVLYVPEFYKNIISGQKLLQNEAYKLVVSHREAQLINTMNDNKICMPLQRNPNPLWYLNAIRVPPSKETTGRVSLLPPGRAKKDDDFKEVLNLKVLNYINNTKKQVNRLTGTPTQPHKATTPNLDINIAHGRLAHAHEGTIRKTLAASGITATGSMLSCGPCNLYKAKARALPKTAT